MLLFEWDDSKAASNRKKHGISFELAAQVFGDPFALAEQNRVEGGEYRWKTLGMVEGVLILLVLTPLRKQDKTRSFGSFQLAVRPVRSEPVMMKTVNKTAAECKLTAKHKRELVKLAAQPDGAIDLSDIPELTDEFFKNAVRNPFYRPVKKQITMRLDSDVIAWLKRAGPGYQTRANDLLRKLMVDDVEKAG